MWIIILLLIIIIVFAFKLGSLEKKLTYALLARNSIGLDELRLVQIIAPYMESYKQKTGRVDLLWFELGYYEKSNHYEWTYLTSRLTNLLKWKCQERLTKKDKVYKIAHKYMGKYYIEELPPEGTVVFFFKIYFKKYINGFSGSGNFITKDRNIIKEYLQPAKIKDYVMQEYITDLATFKTLKFHSFFFIKKRFNDIT